MTNFDGMVNLDGMAKPRGGGRRGGGGRPYWVGRWGGGDISRNKNKSKSEKLIRSSH